jgi:Protein of unknown function (DUF2946)
MDDIVRQALAKWPNVPACYGWLLLDRRGNWRMRDEAVQRENGLGTPIRHAALIAFIVRNYDVDAAGQWYFQNGPQRVYVELASTPWVVRLMQAEDGTLDLIDQTGAAWEPTCCWLDEQGAVFFTGRAGDGDGVRERIGVLHDHDLGLFADQLDDDEASGGSPDSAGEQRFAWRKEIVLPVQPIQAKELGARFGFVASPEQQQAASA